MIFQVIRLYLKDVLNITWSTLHLASVLFVQPPNFISSKTQETIKMQQQKQPGNQRKYF